LERKEKQEKKRQRRLEKSKTNSDENQEALNDEIENLPE
jgi:hypothetical protein